MEYMVAAYFAIWLVVFVLVFLMYRRQGKIEEELAMLEESLGDMED